MKEVIERFAQKKDKISCILLSFLPLSPSFSLFGGKDQEFSSSHVKFELQIETVSKKLEFNG